MGTWGSGLFSDDLACDIRDEYRQQVEDGVADTEALGATLARFHAYFEDPETSVVSILALAVAQVKLGRLDPGIRTRALDVLDRGADLALWEKENPQALPKRRAVLEQARTLLTGPQPPRKRLRAPRRVSCGLAAGDGLVLPVASGLALLRVVGVRSHRYGETPILEQLPFQASRLPSPQELDRLEAMGPEPWFSAFVAHDKVGWEQAGFQKVVSFTPRPGDEGAYAHTGVAWSEIARRLRDGERPSVLFQ